MIRSGKSIRFTPNEVDELQKLGIDLGAVKSSEDFANALYPWIEALGEVRPDLLEKMVTELARSKGIKLPPRLSVVPSHDSPD